jgi:hypothetical protein
MWWSAEPPKLDEDQPMIFGSVSFSFAPLMSTDSLDVLPHRPEDGIQKYMHRVAK